MSLADELTDEMDNLANARDSWRDRSLDLLSVALEEGATGGIVSICRGIIDDLRLERASGQAALPQPARVSVAIFERIEQPAHQIPAIASVEPEPDPRPELVIPTVLVDAVAEPPPTAPEPPIVCRKCGPVRGAKPADEFSLTKYGKRMPTCKACMLQAQHEGRQRAYENGRKKEQPAPPPPPPAPAREAAPLFDANRVLSKAAAGEPADAIEEYRAHLAGGNPMSNGFEGQLMARWGLNRTEVMRIREHVSKERKGIRTNKCRECLQPFDLRPGDTFDSPFCPDCRAVAKSVEREFAPA